MSLLLNELKKLGKQFRCCNMRGEQKFARRMEAGQWQRLNLTVKVCLAILSFGFLCRFQTVCLKACC